MLELGLRYLNVAHHFFGVQKQFACLEHWNQILIFEHVNDMIMG